MKPVEAFSPGVVNVMSMKMPEESVPSHLANRDIPRRMVKAELKDASLEDFRQQMGACLDKARHDLRWNLDRLALELKRDRAQVGRWICGQENVQLHVVWSVPQLRTRFVLALATLDSTACEVHAVVRVKVSA